MRSDKDRGMGRKVAHVLTQFENVQNKITYRRITGTVGGGWRAGRGGRRNKNTAGDVIKGAPGGESYPARKGGREDKTKTWTR